MSDSSLALKCLKVYVIHSLCTQFYAHSFLIGQLLNNYDSLVTLLHTLKFQFKPTGAEGGTCTKDRNDPGQ